MSSIVKDLYSMALDNDICTAVFIYLYSLGV